MPAHPFAILDALSKRVRNGRTERRVSVPAPQPHQRLAVIRVRGSQEEMGAQHAAALVQLGGYQALVEFYSEFLERTLLHADAKSQPRSPARHAVRALGDLLMRRVERDRPTAYRLRSRAFMEGLGMPADHARYLTIMDVLQNLVGVAGRVRLGPFSRLAARAAMPACSTLMVWGEASLGGQLVHARNFDFPGIGIWDRGPTVVFCDPDRGLRYGFVTSRGADTPGVSAFNEAGISVTMHTRFHRDVAFRGAAVVDVGHDIARRAECIEDAVAIVRERPVASTWGMAVSSAREQRAVVIETTARNVCVVEAEAEAGAEGRARDHLSCANRYRHANTMTGQVAPSVAWDVHSSGRQASLRAAVDEARPRGGMTVADLQKALDGHVHPHAPGVHRGAGAVVSQPATVKSIVIEPEARRVHVSVGPAPTSRGPYVEVPWDWDGALGGVELEHAAATPAAETGIGRASDAERAYLHYTEASRLDSYAGDWRGALQEIERAVALRPRDPSYRFLAGVLRLRTPEHERALAHLMAGLETEELPQHRGQLLLWAARAADATGDTGLARTLRAELLCMDHEQLVEHRAWAQAEERKPFDPRKRRVRLDMLFSDAW